MSHSLDLSGLAKGLYIVKARAGKQVFSDKIIKQ
ncbi:MAG TPA: T9SS type A sorting domain-containing protein [Bacteroidetes bacterium]|nr:T9SS type A sorting domain-containing protein [Bacteroidota bacterium]